MSRAAHAEGRVCDRGAEPGNILRLSALRYWDVFPALHRRRAVACMEHCTGFSADAFRRRAGGSPDFLRRRCVKRPKGQRERCLNEPPNPLAPPLNPVRRPLPPSRPGAPRNDQCGRRRIARASMLLCRHRGGATKPSATRAEPAQMCARVTCLNAGASTGFARSSRL